MGVAHGCDRNTTSSEEMDLYRPVKKSNTFAQVKSKFYKFQGISYFHEK